MPPEKSHLSIHAAVMNCVGRCAESDTPFVVLEDFLEKLRALGWNSADVNAVRTAVVPLLGELRSSDTVRLGSDIKADRAQ